MHSGLRINLCCLFVSGCACKHPIASRYAYVALNLNILISGTLSAAYVIHCSSFGQCLSTDILEQIGATNTLDSNGDACMCMHVCACVCVCVCTCACGEECGMCACVYVLVRLCQCMCASARMCVRACVHAYMRRCVRARGVCVCVCLSVCPSVCVCVCV